jgi:hypothetical protein
VSFAAITLCVASQRVFIVVVVVIIIIYFVIDPVRKLLNTPPYLSYYKLCTCARTPEDDDLEIFTRIQCRHWKLLESFTFRSLLMAGNTGSQ